MIWYQPYVTILIPWCKNLYCILESLSGSLSQAIFKPTSFKPKFFTGFSEKCFTLQYDDVLKILFLFASEAQECSGLTWFLKKIKENHCHCIGGVWARWTQRRGGAHKMKRNKNKSFCFQGQSFDHWLHWATISRLWMLADKNYVLLCTYCQAWVTEPEFKYQVNKTKYFPLWQREEFNIITDGRTDTQTEWLPGLPVEAKNKYKYKCLSQKAKATNLNS